MSMIEPREICASRGKMLIYLVIALLFVGIGIWMIRDSTDSRSLGWITLGIFGLCAVVFLFQIVRPYRLLLDRDGFTLSGGVARSPRSVAWRDVDKFFVYRLPRGGKMIGYDLVPEAQKHNFMGDLNRRLGADGALPKGWRGSPDKFVDELNAYRSQALADQCSARPLKPPAAPV